MRRPSKDSLRVPQAGDKIWIGPLFCAIGILFMARGIVNLAHGEHTLGTILDISLLCIGVGAFVIGVLNIRVDFLALRLRRRTTGEEDSE